MSTRKDKMTTAPREEDDALNAHCTSVKNDSKAPTQRLECRVLYPRLDQGGYTMAFIREERGAGVNRRIFNALFPREVTLPRKSKGWLIVILGEPLYLPIRGSSLPPWWIVVHKILNPDGATVIPFPRRVASQTPSTPRPPGRALVRPA